MRKLLTITTEEAQSDKCTEFNTIAIGGNTYKVLSVIFQFLAFIGQVTKVFLVQFEDGQEGVLKDSFITSNRPTEESILNGLTIPFGPDIIDHCILGDTVTFRESLLSPAKLLETWQK